MVTWENYEEYMVLHADGELQGTEEQALMAFVAQHPELKDELDLSVAVKLVPDTTVVYAKKESLMKPVPATKKVIAMPMWQRYAVAAGIAAVICLSVMKYKEVVVEPVEVAKVNTTEPALRNASNGSSNVAAPGKETGVPVVPVVTPEQVSKHKEMVAARLKGAHSKHEELKGEHVQDRVVAHEQIAELMTADTKALPVENEPVKLMAVNVMPVMNLDQQTETKKTLLESLPIEDIKKDGMADVAGVLAQTYKKMNALKHVVTDEKSISVRVEKKQLIVSF